MHDPVLHNSEDGIAIEPVCAGIRDLNAPGRDIPRAAGRTANSRVRRSRQSLDVPVQFGKQEQSIEPIAEDPEETSFRPRCATIETASVELTPTEGGERLNQYFMAQPLGKGAYGTVRLCQNTETKENFAVKVISKRRLMRKSGFPMKKRADPLTDLRKEVAILKKVDHPHIVKLYEVIDDPSHDNVYMVFELLKLGPVMDMTNPASVRQLTERRANTYFRQLILAIEFLHAHNVIHRDIKPANLLLNSLRSIRVCDFGVSHNDEETAPDQPCKLSKTAGTPAFLAPEAVCIDGTHYEGPPVDIWAMGITLYCFLFGETPFVGVSEGNQRPTLLQLHEAIRTQPVPLDRERDPPLSDSCKDVLQQLLEKDPAKRITMDELREHPWVTSDGRRRLKSKEQNVTMVEVTEAEVQASMTTTLQKQMKSSIIESRRRSSSEPVRSLSRPDKMRSYELLEQMQGIKEDRNSGGDIASCETPDLVVQSGSGIIEPRTASETSDNVMPRTESDASATTRTTWSNGLDGSTGRSGSPGIPNAPSIVSRTSSSERLRLVATAKSNKLLKMLAKAREEGKDVAF